MAGPTRMYDLRTLAARFGVTTATVANWIKSGELRAVNVGRAPGKKKPRWRVTQGALDAFEAARTTTAAPPRVRRKRRADVGVVEFY